MDRITIKKEIDINAPKDKVWKVLLEDATFRVWGAEFSPGTFAISDWQVGSKVTFQDASNSGLVGKIVEHVPNEVITMQYYAELQDNREVYDTPDAEAIKGGIETYHVSEKDGVTHLTIAADMSMRMAELMEDSWDRAILKIKELSENN